MEYVADEKERRKKIAERRGIKWEPSENKGGDVAALFYKLRRYKRSFQRAARMHQIAQSAAAKRGKDFREDKKGTGYMSLRKAPQPFAKLKIVQKLNSKKIRPPPMKVVQPANSGAVSTVVQAKDAEEQAPADETKKEREKRLACLRQRKKRKEDGPKVMKKKPATGAERMRALREREEEADRLAQAAQEKDKKKTAKSTASTKPSAGSVEVKKVAAGKGAAKTTTATAGGKQSAATTKADVGTKAMKTAKGTTTIATKKANGKQKETKAAL